MAEIQSSETKSKGVAKSKKLSTRVDLTPMVDLGFLLLTFFIFTTTMSQATAVNLTMPDDSEVITETKVQDKYVLQVLLLNNDSIICVQGKEYQKGKLLSNTDFRNEIMQKQKQLGNKKSELTVLIKPSAESSYKNVVDVLDEMTINNVEHYMILDGAEKDFKNIE